MSTFGIEFPTRVYVVASSRAEFMAFAAENNLSQVKSIDGRNWFGDYTQAWHNLQEPDNKVFITVDLEAWDDLTFMLKTTTSSLEWSAGIEVILLPGGMVMASPTLLEAVRELRQRNNRTTA